MAHLWFTDVQDRPTDARKEPIVTGSGYPPRNRAARS